MNSHNRNLLPQCLFQSFGQASRLYTSTGNR